MATTDPRIPAAKSEQIMCDATLRNAQCRWALILVASISVVYVVVDVMSRDRLFLDTLLEHQVSAAARDPATVFQYKVGFQESNDRLFIEVLPTADFTQGGVYFFGASVMHSSFAEPLLRPEVRQYLHNFALLGANHKEQYQFMRYLVDRRGLLRAGPAKNLVVIGLTYLDSAPRVGEQGEAFMVGAVERHGLYSYNPENGFSDRPLLPITRFLYLERYRSMAWIRALLIGDEYPRRSVRPTNGVYNAEDIAKTREWVVGTYAIGTEFAKQRSAQIEYVREMIQYLQTRDTNVMAVLLPLASWNHAMPEADEYVDRVTALCSEFKVPLCDLRWQLSDAEFGDHVHPNYLGTQAMTKLLADLALRNWQAQQTSRPGAPD